ncbi:MAG: hypothetical protein ACJ74U_13885 [Jatrophihabitantaceae bacterium]
MPPAASSAARTTIAAIGQAELFADDRWSAAGLTVVGWPPDAFGLVVVLVVPLDGRGEAVDGPGVGAAVVWACVPLAPPLGRFPGAGTVFGAGYVVGAGWNTVTVNVVRAVAVPWVAAIVTAPGRVEPGIRTTRLKVPSARTGAVSTFSADTERATGPQDVQNARPVTCTVVNGGP